MTREELLQKCSCEIIDGHMALYTKCPVHGHHARVLIKGDIALDMAQNAIWSENDNPVEQLIIERDEAIREAAELADYRRRLIEMLDAVTALADSALARLRSGKYDSARTYLTALLRLMAEERDSLPFPLGPGTGAPHGSRPDLRPKTGERG